MNIPDEAVYAAVKALPPDPAYINVESVRVALAAALPHLETAGIRELEEDLAASHAVFSDAEAHRDGQRYKLEARVKELEDGIREAVADECSVGSVGKWCSYCDACKANRPLIRLLTTRQEKP